MCNLPARQADVQARGHKLDGIFAFEVLRQLVGEAEAERAVAVEYPYIGAERSGASDQVVERCGRDVNVA